MLRQIDRLIGDHLDQEVLQSGVQAGVHIPQHIGLDQVREIAARDHTDANEGGQQGAALEDNLLGEGIVEDQAAKVKQHLGQREEREEAE